MGSIYDPHSNDYLGLVKPFKNKDVSVTTFVVFAALLKQKTSDHRKREVSFDLFAISSIVLLFFSHSHLTF